MEHCCSHLQSAACALEKVLLVKVCQLESRIYEPRSGLRTSVACTSHAFHFQIFRLWTNLTPMEGVLQQRVATQQLQIVQGQQQRLPATI